jgi:hypothetical protein
MATDSSPFPQRAPSFTDRLSLELTLTLGTDSFTIPGGQVKELSAHLASYGFSASVSFWSRLEKKDEPLYEAFLKPDLARVRLAISGVFDVPDQAPPPLVLQGLVTTRRLTSEAHGSVEGEQRLFRRYTLEFADAAQVLWRQHRPTELYTGKTLADVLEAHTVDPIQLSLEWDLLKSQHPMLCLALGEDAPATSFYDFVLWYVSSRGGVWTYDNQEDRYLLSGSKPRSSKPKPLGATEVQQVELSLPPVPRHGTRVLNSFAVTPKTTDLERPAYAAPGVWREVLLRTPLTSEAEQREALEKQLLRNPEQRLWLAFNRFPSVPVHPGAGLKLAGDLWPPKLVGAGKPQRVRELFLSALASRPGPEFDTQMPSAGYQLSLSALLEAESDKVPLLPHFQPPRYPIYVEGKVHSPGGEETDKSYFLAEDKENSLLFWRVNVPLWNKTVSVPAEPNHFPGHFYFPPYKNSRVLLALYLDRAELHRFLDWGENVRLPQDGQGDQVLLGKNKKSQTAFTHDYQEDKPVWRLHRTSANDEQLIRFSEGNIYIEVKEDKAALTTTPTFDVTPQVEGAKAELASSVGGAIGETTAVYQGAMGAASAEIEGASAESMAALEAANAAVSAEVSAARAELSASLGKLSESGAALNAAVAEAKAALKGLL